MVLFLKMFLGDIFGGMGREFRPGITGPVTFIAFLPRERLVVWM